MACCWMISSYYLNRCLLCIWTALWHLFEGIFIRRSEDTNGKIIIENCILKIAFRHFICQRVNEYTYKMKVEINQSLLQNTIHKIFQSVIRTLRNFTHLARDSCCSGCSQVAQIQPHHSSTAYIKMTSSKSSDGLWNLTTSSYIPQWLVLGIYLGGPTALRSLQISSFNWLAAPHTSACGAKIMSYRYRVGRSFLNWTGISMLPRRLLALQ